MATLNTIVKRIETIALAHKQVRNFYYGNVVDFLVARKAQYAAVFLQDTGGNVGFSDKTITLNFRLFALDLVHVAADAKDNELDVQSDMLQVLSDLLAEIDHSEHTDWKVGTQNSITFVREELDDLVAGVTADITISIPYAKDTCAVPTDVYDLSDLT
jgi:hypothetical protein